MLPITRRSAGRSLLAAAALPVANPAAQRKPVDEYAASNMKIAHRVSPKITDEDLLFMKQIGLRWARVEFGDGDVSFEAIRATQERFAKFGIGIFSGVHYAYRKLEVQLGRDGRDREIERYRAFLRDLGKLGIPIAS